MSGVYGPFALTPNAATIGQQQVDPRTVLIYVDNDSPYDVFFSSSVIQPRPQASSRGDNDWEAVVPAGNHQTIWTAPEDRYNSPLGAGGFQGMVSYYAIDPGGLVSPGIISSRANLYIRTFYKGEQPPSDYAVPNHVELSSQPRVLSVPSSVSGVANGVWDMTVNGGVLTALTTTINGAVAKKVVYVYGVLITALTAGSADVSLSVQPQSNVGNVGTVKVIARGVVSNTMPLALLFPWPISLGVDANVGQPYSGAIKTIYNLTFLRGTALAQATYTFFYEEDLTSATPIASPAGGINGYATTTKLGAGTFIQPG